MSLQAVARDIRDLAPFFIELEQASNKREAEKAKADPLANKLTRVFDPGVSTNYRYYRAAKDGLGRQIRFCWSSHRNAAGFFLGWREVIGKKETKRDMWLARRVKARCKEIAKRRAGLEIADSQDGPSVPLRSYRVELEQRLRATRSAIHSETAQPINQCDGCRRELRLGHSAVPFSLTMIHYDENGVAVMACTADRYQKQGGDKTDGQTPRTDEAEVYYSEIVTGRDAGLYWVKAEFAQQIERELNAAQSATPQTLLAAKVEAFRALPANWDSYGADTFSYETISLALEVARHLGPEWKCVPCADGPSVQFYRRNEDDIINVRSTTDSGTEQRDISSPAVKEDQ